MMSCGERFLPKTRFGLRFTTKSIANKTCSAIFNCRNSASGSTRDFRHGCALKLRRKASTDPRPLVRISQD